MRALEFGVVGFHSSNLLGNDYRYRFEQEAKEQFLGLLRERFNSGVMYNGRALKWDTVLERKADEICLFLTGKSKRIEFDEPAPTLERQDGRELRTRILALTQSEAQRIRIGKSTLFHLRRKSRNDRSFRVYGKVIRRMGSLR